MLGKPFDRGKLDGPGDEGALETLLLPPQVYLPPLWAVGAADVKTIEESASSETEATLVNILTVDDSRLAISIIDRTQSDRSRCQRKTVMMTVQIK